MVGRRAEWARLREFATSGGENASLGIVWGRRRVGKSYLLASLVDETGGFYYEAVRGSSGEALRELGERIGLYQGAAAPLALADWDAAVGVLLSLAGERERLVVLDEYPYLLEHTPELDSIIQRAFGPGSAGRGSSRARLVLCGSAMAVMSRILTGTAPLRGRAGMDLRISPFDFRVARDLHGIDEPATALRTYLVIGGVPAYAREMVDGDLPTGAPDFDRWLCRRVLSPAAPLFGEVGLLLSEDPSTARARKINLYHAALAGIATGHHAHGKLTRYVRITGASLAPILDALVSAELIERVQDPIRENRPTYHPGDPLIRFHYAVIRRHHERFSRHDANTLRIWRHVRPTFESQVVGPGFEAAARYWTAHFADPITLGGQPDHVGPTTISLVDGSGMEVDVVVAAADSRVASERRILSLGEAKAGERISERHLQRLEEARSALGDRAADAKLLLFGMDFTPSLTATATRRGDVELIDLDRLYGGE
ncbi:MAG TPA: ATP-binding protein [Gemmatimonadota bacterium]|nr:ATP-binding protein [Gemmatimonadota bacterium]